jgi:hypothetical protein
VTDSYTYYREIPDTRLIERLLAGHPDAGQLMAIISRSYDYIQTLPLKGLNENYSRENSELYALVL